MGDTPLIGQRLKSLIKESGLEQRQVAILLGIKVSTFNSYVTGFREPSVAVLMQVARYFNISLDYLSGFSEIKDPYMKHLPEDLNLFVHEPKNMAFIKMAKDIKDEALNAVREEIEAAVEENGSF